MTAETEPDDPVDAAPGAEGTPTPWRLGTWLAELLSVPVGVLEAYVPGSGGVTARTREQLILTVTEVNGSRYSAWVHGAWLDFLGPRDLDEALLPLFDYARACAEAGVPLDTTTLQAAYPAPLVRSLRATVAQAELGNLVGATVDEALAHVPGRRGWSPGALLQSTAVLAMTAPFVVPTVAAAAGMKVLARLAPSLPAIDVPPAGEANLVVHLLAEAVPTYLGHVCVRTGLVWSPLPVAIAFRMEGTSATIRVGRGRVAIDNGVQPDALLVVDGGVEPLLQTVAGSILRDMGVPIRRHR